MKTTGWMGLVLVALYGCGGAAFTNLDAPHEDGGGAVETSSTVDSGAGTLDQRTVSPEAGREDANATDADAGSVPESGAHDANASSGSSSGSSSSGASSGSSSGSSSSSSGSSSGSSGGDAGDSGPPKVCCHFASGSVTPDMPCSPIAWLCTGAQTFSCTQAGECTVGLTCYVSGGPYGGTVETCP